MPQSFFSKLKNKFKADYGGRYMAIVLGEIIRQSPEIADLIWETKLGLKKVKDFTVPEEWRFPNKRRADLAILDSKHVPLALLEVKYEDHKASKTVAQIDDYLKYCDKKPQIPFLYLTRHLLPKKDSKIAKQHLTYTQLLRKLDKMKDKSPVVIMLYDYLKDEGGYMFEEVDNTNLQLLIVKSTAFPHAAGFGRLNTRDRITTAAPGTFKTVLQNAAVISNRFYEDIGCDLFNQQPTVDYAFTTHLNTKKLSKFMKDGSESIAVDKPKKVVVGGDLWAGAQGKFKNAKRLYLKFGFSYALKVGDKIERGLFAEFFWNGRTVNREFKKIQPKSAEDQVYKTLLNIIKDLTSFTLTKKTFLQNSDEYKRLNELKSKLKQN